MIKKRQIHPSVQQELYRKMDSLDRLRLTEGAVPNHNFFIGGAFDSSLRASLIKGMAL